MLLSYQAGRDGRLDTLNTKIRPLFQILWALRAHFANSLRTRSRRSSSTKRNLVFVDTLVYLQKGKPPALSSYLGLFRSVPTALIMGWKECDLGLDSLISQPTGCVFSENDDSLGKFVDESILGTGRNTHVDQQEQNH